MFYKATEVVCLLGVYYGAAVGDTLLSILWATMGVWTVLSRNGGRPA